MWGVRSVAESGRGLRWWTRGLGRRTRWRANLSNSGDRPGGLRGSPRKCWVLVGHVVRDRLSRFLGAACSGQTTGATGPKAINSRNGVDHDGREVASTTYAACLRTMPGSVAVFLATSNRSDC